MSNPSSIKNFVLENSQGQVIRSFRWDHPQFYLIRRMDTGRVEAHSSLTNLDAQGIKFEVLTSTTPQIVLSNGVNIPRVGRLVKKESQKETLFSPSVVVKRDEPALFFGVLRWSAIAHFSALLLLFVGYWAHQNFFVEEDVTVKIMARKLTTPKIRKTVKASNKKINRKLKVGKKRPVKNRTKARRKSLTKIGALAAFGGQSKGQSGGRGLNLKSALNNTGQGNSMGIRSAGKNTNSIPGKGLFSQSGGQGKQNLGTVGYGTRGRAGGKAGYGKLNIGGAMGAYEHPVQEEGSVEGGLEKSQIESVIQRNIGQIIYCYEKGLQKTPGMRGRVAVNFVINGAGRVRTAGVRHSSLKSASVEACMTGKIRNWKFPKPHGNVDVKVSYPFVLRRAHQR